MEELKFCQSCGMPLNEGTQKGTNSDGSLSDDYCLYCYSNGKFNNEYSMQEMLEINLQYIDEYNKDAKQAMTKDQTREYLEKEMPNWKRWKK